VVANLLLLSQLKFSRRRSASADLGGTSTSRANLARTRPHTPRRAHRPARIRPLPPAPPTSAPRSTSTSRVTHPPARPLAVRPVEARPPQRRRLLARHRRQPLRVDAHPGRAYVEAWTVAPVGPGQQSTTGKRPRASDPSGEDRPGSSPVVHSPAVRPSAAMTPCDVTSIDGRRVDAPPACGPIASAIAQREPDRPSLCVLH
jgi:hypothetical protein